MSFFPLGFSFLSRKNPSRFQAKKKKAPPPSLLTDQHPVVARDRLRDVRDERVRAAAQPALLARRLGPSQVREVRVDGDADDLGADRAELGDAVGEGDDLCLLSLFVCFCVEARVHFVVVDPVSGRVERWRGEEQGGGG